MINFEIIKDKSIALLIWNTEKENDVHVYLGKIINKGNKYCFVNEEKNWNISITPESYERLKLVDEDTKEIFLNADYFISLSLGGLPDNSNEDFNSTGINWNEK